jgi:hypothetical protein
MAATSGSSQGMGVFDFTTAASGWKLGVPGTAFSGSYASTVTITIAPAL